MTKYREREISKSLLEALAEMPVVVLSGMRQTGKSTLLLNQSQLRNRKYLSFDDYNILESTRRNPEGIFEGNKPITIDEAHKLPEILAIIKREVDRDRRPGRFILSGSANFLLLRKVADTLAGRAVYLTLSPFTRRETLGITDKTPVLIQFIKKGVFPECTSKHLTWQEILKGGMPSVCLGEVRKSDIWFRGYEQTYLERDIRSLSQVADLVTFRYLMQLVAYRNTQVLKQSELARDAKLNAVTTARYLGLMETSYVIRRIHPYFGNPSSRLIKSPKLYMTDTGLAAYLMGIKGLTIPEPLRGILLESYVAQNLDGIISTNAPDINTRYWNIQGRYEVDFILEVGRDTIAIEVKNSSRWRENDLVGLKAFLNSTRSCRAAILAYNGTNTLRLADKIWAVPISLLIS